MIYYFFNEVGFVIFCLFLQILRPNQIFFNNICVFKLLIKFAADGEN